MLKTVEHVHVVRFLMWSRGDLVDISEDKAPHYTMHYDELRTSNIFVFGTRYWAYCSFQVGLYFWTLDMVTKLSLLYSCYCTNPLNH